MKTPLLKKQRIYRGLIIAIASLYAISVLERTLIKEETPTELLIEHNAEKARMQTKIQILEKQIHDYEIELLKIRTDVDDLSNDQIDSVWTNIFK